MAATVRLFLQLCIPPTVVGHMGLLAFVASLYLSLKRRDGNNALFFISLGWLLLVLDTAYAFPREAFPKLGFMLQPRHWYPLQATCRFLGRLVPPLLLSMPAVWCVLRPEHAESLRKARLRAVATVVVVADALLLLLFLTALLWPSEPLWNPPRVFVFRVQGILCFLAALYFFLRRRDGDEGIAYLFVGWVCAVADVVVRLLIALMYYTANMDRGHVSHEFTYLPAQGVFHLTGRFGTPAFEPLLLRIEVWKSLLVMAVAMLLAAVAAYCALLPQNVQGVVRGRRWIVAAMACFLHVVLLLIFLTIWSELPAFSGMFGREP